MTIQQLAEKLLAQAFEYRQHSSRTDWLRSDYIVYPDELVAALATILAERMREQDDWCDVRGFELVSHEAAFLVVLF